VIRSTEYQIDSQCQQSWLMTELVSLLIHSIGVHSSTHYSTEST